jgi:hypothetical protein
MQSPTHHQDESNMDDSIQAEKMCFKENASASTTPSKKVKFSAGKEASKGIQKAVTKRGTRNQSIRNNRVRVKECN